MNNLDHFMKLLYKSSKIKKREGSIYFYKKQSDFEFDRIEIKGSGHPDTLADALAFELSRNYSLYCINQFGVILNHNFDKIGILGGKVKIRFGFGRMLSPIRVIINGRASTKFAGKTIPLKSLLIKITKDFFKEKFPMLNIKEDLRIIYEVSQGSSPGQVYEKITSYKRLHWFKPRGREDIKYLNGLVANDTVTTSAYYPLNKTGKIILEVEKRLNSKKYKSNKSWLGSDIKITGIRHFNKLYLTMAVPQICSHVHNLEEYKSNLEIIRKEVLKIIKSIDPNLDVNLLINTRDKYDPPELYLTYTGSSIETGDEGLVGRGNRPEGIINMTKPFAMEGVCGKNPVYHAGFIYSELSKKISKKLCEFIGDYVEVFISSQSGRPLLDPWNISIINYSFKEFNKDKVKKIIFKELENIPEITREFLNGDIKSF